MMHINLKLTFSVHKHILLANYNGTIRNMIWKETNFAD